MSDNQFPGTTESWQQPADPNGSPQPADPYVQQQPQNPYAQQPQGSYPQQPQDAYGQQQPAGGYGQPQQMGYNQQQPPYTYGYAQPGLSEKSKMVAGLLGILLGVFGVHNFYLGNTGRAVAQLLISILSLGILAIVSMIWGLVEGIQILTSAPGTKWHKDAAGLELRD